MKGDELNNEQFINVCEHILTNLGIIKGNLYPDYFRNYTSCNYTKYKRQSGERNIEFSLSEIEFYNIIQNDCYLCGKIISGSHNNGIDRIDSNIGYFYNNCKSCCGTCNYLKNNYQLYNLLNKMLNIYNHHNNKQYEIEQNIINNILIPYVINDNLDIDDIANKRGTSMREKERIRKQKERAKLKMNIGKGEFHVKGAQEKEIDNVGEDINIIIKHKLTREEKRDKGTIRKQKNREKLGDKYADEEYRKKHAQEIANNREKKKNNGNH
jgi:hypothetical protein